MGRSQVSALVQEHHRYVLAFLAFVVFFLGLAVSIARPMDLAAGQNGSWFGVIQNIQQGRGFKSCETDYVPNCSLTEQYTATREPLPVFLFAFLGTLTNNSILMFELLQISMVILILFGVFQIGRELGGPGVGLVAGLLWVAYLPAVRLETSLTGDLLEGVFVAFGFLSFIRILQDNQWKDWLGFGILFGLATLSRSAALILVFSLGLAYILSLVLNRRGIPERLFLNVSVSVLAFVLILLPWFIRNWLTFDQPLIGGTLLGYNLYRHNAIVAQDVPAHYVGPVEAERLVDELVARHPELLTPLNEAEVDDIFRQEAFKLIQAHPLRYMKLSLYRFLPLWFNIGVDEQYGSDMSAFDVLIVIEQTVILLFFLLGLRAGGRFVRLMGLAVAIYLLAYMAIEAQLRYVIPVASIILAIASIGISSLLSGRLRSASR